MLDPKLIRENPEAIKQATRVKHVGSPELVDAWLAADEKRRAMQTQADTLLSEQSHLGQQIQMLQMAKPVKSAFPMLPPEQRAIEEEKLARAEAEIGRIKEKSADLKGKIKEFSDLKTRAEAEANQIMLQLPAIPDPNWPIGDDDKANVVVRTWADSHGPQAMALGKDRKDHLALGQQLGILDFDRGVKIAGSRSYVLRGLGAKLYQAVLRYAMDVITSRGYEPFVVPVLVTEQCMIGTGYFPAGREQAYVTQDNSVLVGTSEVPLASFHGDEILDEKDLPKRFCASSSCFRREAGAAGKDTAGLYRVHQFDKVEQVVVHKADDAEHIALHEEIIANSEFILQSLRLPYRVVQNCTGDMGQGKWRMYDIETWMPSRNGYGETHSGSALKDFQARRLNLRYRPTGSKSPVFCYTLNNTAIACPRILIAIFENYQNSDGSITIPDVLRPYVGGTERIG